MFAVLGSISGQDGEHSINEDDEVSAAVLDALGDVPYYDERNGNASGINGKQLSLFLDKLHQIIMGAIRF